MRGALVAGLSAIAVLVFAPGSQAAPRPPFGAPAYLDQQVSSAHFVVHYTQTGGVAADRLSTADANALLGYAETAYGYYVAQWGYPAPLNDGDAKTDIYVWALPSALGGAAAGPDTDADQTTGFVYLDPPRARSVYPVAHEYFHVIQMGVYQQAGFFVESSAEWAGQAVVAATGGSPPPNWYPDPYVPLDCDSCTGGYHGSIFWEYLRERFGVGIAHEAYDRDAALAALAGDHQPHDLQALADVLATHGSSLADAMNGYAFAANAGQITRPGVLPNLPDPFQSVAPGPEIQYVPLPVTVDHLALERVAFAGAGTAEDRPCASATLRLQVDLPADAASQPAFAVYPASGEPPATATYPLAISGSSASADIPWQTCSAYTGSLVLPNASSTADDQTFTVHFAVEQPVPSRPKLRAKRSQDVDKLYVVVTSDTAATLNGQASVKLPGGSVESKRARAKVAAGAATKLRLRFSKASVRSIKRVLTSGKHPSAKIEVTATDAADAFVTARVKVKLKD